MGFYVAASNNVSTGSDISGSNQILKGNKYKPPPPHGDRSNRAQRGFWGGGEIKLRNNAKKQKKAERQSSIRVFEQHGAIRREQVNGKGSHTCPNQERGSHDGSADPGSRLRGVCQGDCGSAGFWERTERLIYVRGKEGRRTAAVVVSCCRLECTNTSFMTSSSFQSLSVSL